MKDIFSYFFMLLIPILIFKRQYKPLFVLLMISMFCSDFAIRFLGFSRLTIGQYIALLQFPFILGFYKHSLLKKGFSLIRAFSLEFFILIFLVFFFNFVSPFEYGLDIERPFGRDMIGRSILGSFRIFSDMAIMIFVVFLFKNRHIDFNFFIKVMFIICAVQFCWAFIDYYGGWPLKRLMKKSFKVMNRPTGFCYEPKSLGRLTFGGFLIVFSLFLGKDRYFKVPLYVLATFMAVIIFAQSLSTLAAGFLTIVFTLVFFLSKKNLGRFVTTTIIIGIAVIVSINNPNFKMLQTKAKWVLHLVEIDRAKNEPRIFVYLTHADRSAANLMYFNPKYFIMGCGPNLVTIPSVKYVSRYLESWAGTGMSDELPNTFIYYLSRSGIFGFSIFLNCFIQLRRRIKKHKYKSFMYLLVSTFIFTAINNQLWFYMNLAVIYGVLYYQPDTLSVKPKRRIISKSIDPPPIKPNLASSI